MNELGCVNSLSEHELNGALVELDRYESSQSLLEFIKLAWHVLEPGTTFIPGWHLEAICEHLEAVSNGDIRRLLINVPPGAMKSMSTNVFWPAWEWGPRNEPFLRYVSSSYSADLSIRDNRASRTLILSEWYQERWGDRFCLAGDQNMKTMYENNHRGFRIATSVGGSSTGKRGDRLIVDDPHNVVDGESDKKREEAVKWFREVMQTRVNKPAKTPIIVIMQRVHQRDISGVILAKEFGYEHLMIPMEFEPERKCVTSIGWEDPREEDGELMWPEFFTQEAVDEAKHTMGAYATAGQMQQRPSPRGGGMFKEEWIEIVEESPEGGTVVRGWDLAATDDSDDAAFTVGCRVREVPEMVDDKLVPVYYIEHVVRKRLSAGGVKKLMLGTANSDGMNVVQSIPQDPGQAGKAQVREFRRLLTGFAVRTSVESGSKETRAETVAGLAEQGMVKMVRGEWNQTLIDELTVFPNSTFKDQADALSRAVAELIPKKRKTSIAAPEVIYG